MYKNNSAVRTDQLRQAWQNRQPRGEPVRLGVLVKALVQAEGLKEVSPLAGLQDVWEQQVGPELSKHSRLEGFRRGTLRVEVDSAAHMAELKGLVQDGLTDRLNEWSQERAIKSIHLRLGSQGPGPTQARRSRKERSSYDQS